MDFGILPPEINSGRMYSGPGSGPMLAAAAAWDGLVAELHSAAASYEYEIASLTGGPWLGPASASMTAAARTQVEWLSTTAALAEQTATQAEAAVAAYEAAFTATVPPPVIAANRTLLMVLIATNILGQNTPAIAATEAQYAEMWAQDAAAMYGYASASAGAAALTPFTPPAPTTNPGGLAQQAAAVARAAGAPAATNAQAVLSQLTSAIPAALQGLASPLHSTSAAASSTSGLAAILQNLGLNSLDSLLTPASTSLTTTGMSAGFASLNSASHADAAILSTQDQIAGTESRIMNRFDQLGTLATARPGGGPAGLGAGGGSAVGLSRAAVVGGLSVPQGWAVRTPAMRTVALALPASSFSAAAEGLAGSPGSTFSEMALASTAMAGRAVDSTVGSGRWERVLATNRAGAALPHRSPGSPLTGVAAELRELAELRESGILTDDEFSKQKRRLLGQ
jgi:PPE-repeat protein